MITCSLSPSLSVVNWFLLLLIVLKLSIIIRYDKHKVGKLKSAKHFRKIVGALQLFRKRFHGFNLFLFLFSDFMY